MEKLRESPKTDWLTGEIVPNDQCGCIERTLPMKRYIAAVTVILLGVVAYGVSVYAGGQAKTEYAAYPVKKLTKHALPYDDRTKAIICTDRPIPPNWVIVGVRNTPGCNGLCNNSWVIQRLPNYPGAEIVICNMQPIPPGWAVVENVKSCYCGHKVDGIRIRKM
jgi:hypothetical protein